MHIYMLLHDPLESQGLKWLLTSQWNDMQVTIAEQAADLEWMHEADFYIIDMKFITEGKMTIPAHVKWLGLSSERTFQTVYEALSMKAEDILFRPLQPERLISHVQQLRFRRRNEKVQLKRQNKSDLPLTYEDFLVGNTYPDRLLLIGLIAPSHLDKLRYLVRELERYDFPTRYDVFPFSDFVLVVHEMKESAELQEAYRAFFSEWKYQSDTLLTIYLHEGTKRISYRELYRKMRRFHERIFYDGYDILTLEEKDIHWRDLDPFLSPLEQRKWIEMLEKQQSAEIRSWMEQDFLTLSAPYPNPEMVRIRLTSILAQVRRYMTSKSLISEAAESAYLTLFETIIREPVVYRIVESFITFVTTLFGTAQIVSRQSTLVEEKVRERIALNYWNASWSLAACAEELNMHKSTLSRKYASEAGESFSDSLLKKRVEEAERLLQETDLSIADVAMAAGFTHATYFSRRFKEATGLTPNQYRNR
ncbi:helix-turn-helix transcriptional regulator [Sporosarcina cyprini]|uniref:helix-turn-helix transcriptional regulator n=1 Tax=Sporosarcina cyprini TaxID=2910523 RepID=UPI001EE02D66|nr:response regulator transcription factor [Sporosarcina cyprini]MCG3087120.1 helix-turn-helix transcriptional regulator [Sporosarcina cyprini]